MKKPSAIKISIIIANYNGEKFLEACLNSIYKEKNKAFEVIIVDDNSQDNSISLLKKNLKWYSNLSLIENKRSRGAAESRNIGVKKSKGEYLFFLDYDTQIKKSWLNEVIQFFESYLDAGAGQAKLLKFNTNFFDYAGDHLSQLGFLVERSKGTVDRGQFDSFDTIFSMKGAAMIVKKDIFNQIGGFDEDYYYLWEEPDLTWRVWLAGYKVYFVPTITVWHHYVTEGKSEEYYKKIDVTYRGVKNGVTTLIKNYGTPKLLSVVPVHILCLICLSVLFLILLEIKKSSDIIRAIFWNIIYLPKILVKRKLIQDSRTISDKKLFNLISIDESSMYFIKKAFSYTLGKPLK